jgi:hypothetical protein
MKQGGNGITDKGALVLAEALKSDCALQFLDLVISKAVVISFLLAQSLRIQQVDNRITDKGALALAEALNSNSSLQRLELVRNTIS